VAQLQSLRRLGLHACANLGMQALERLLSTAVQGCWLTVDVWLWGDVSYREFKAPGSMTTMYGRVLAQRGARDTPKVLLRGLRLLLEASHDA
jgi:hypothetical protein